MNCAPAHVSGTRHGYPRGEAACARRAGGHHLHPHSGQPGDRPTLAQLWGWAHTIVSQSSGKTTQVMNGFTDFYSFT